MCKLARGGDRLKPLYNFASRASSRALCFVLILSMAAPLWSQSPAAQTFEEVEKQATEHREANRLEQAVALYRDGLKLRPSWKEGSWYLGTSLYGLKRYAEARDAFRHLALLEPGNGPAWGLAGMCEFELKNYPRALEYMLRSEGAGLGQSQELTSLVNFRIALLLNREGAFEKSWDRLISIVAAGTFPDVIEALGITVLRAPLLPSEIPEQDRDLYMKAGEAMFSSLTHDNEGATRIFEELVTAYPIRPNVHYAYGSFLMDNDPAKAMLEFQRELETDPSNSNALIQMTRLYLKQGDPEKALPYARRVVKIGPNMAVPHRLLGESLLASGDTPAAIRELETAARLAPEFPQTHFLLAEAYRKTGNKVPASKEMAEFERLDRKQKSEFSNSNTSK